MRTVHLGNVEISAQGSPWALFLYQREFSTPDKQCSWYEDYDAAHKDYKASEDKQVEAVNRLSALDNMFCLKTLWACAASVDDSLPPFEQWLKSLADADIPMVALPLWKMEVSVLINAEIFRYKTQAEKEEAAAE